MAFVETRFRDTEPRGGESKTPARQGGIRRILVCVDGSSFSDAALRHAISVARTFDSAITLLFVLQPAHETADLGATDAYRWEIARQQAGAYLEGLESEITHASGVRVDRRLEQGHPAERITSIARELGADLVVLGSHGESGQMPFNLGSTALQLLTGVHASVLVVRSAGGEKVPPAVTRILLPLDGSPRAESVLPTAARIARAHEAEILLAHIVTEPGPTAMLRAGADLDLAHQLAVRIESRAKQYLEGLCERLRREGLSARSVVTRRADERQSLLDVARTEAVDLVVLSAHGSTCNPARSFGSVAAHLLAHSSVSLLVLQDIPEAGVDRARDAADNDPSPELRASFTAEQH
jgi:nucleotide-binding universal stress UspA family protein